MSPEPSLKQGAEAAFSEGEELRKRFVPNAKEEDVSGVTEFQSFIAKKKQSKQTFNFWLADLVKYLH